MRFSFLSLGHVCISLLQLYHELSPFVDTRKFFLFFSLTVLLIDIFPSDCVDFLGFGATFGYNVVPPYFFNDAGELNGFEINQVLEFECFQFDKESVCWLLMSVVSYDFYGSLFKDDNSMKTMPVFVSQKCICAFPQFTAYYYSWKFDFVYLFNFSVVYLKFLV